MASDISKSAQSPAPVVGADPVAWRYYDTKICFTGYTSRKDVADKYSAVTPLYEVPPTASQTVVDGAPERIWAYDFHPGYAIRKIWSAERLPRVEGVEYVRADLAPTGNAALVEALKNLSNEMRFMLRNNPQMDGGLYRQRLTEAEAALAAAVTPTDNVGAASEPRCVECGGSLSLTSDVVCFPCRSATRKGGAA